MESVHTNQMVEARDYQLRVIDNTFDAIAGGHKSILIESPCGSGKTIMGLSIAKRLSEEDGYSIGWCAMRKHLLIQAATENREKVGIPNIEFFSMFDKNPPPVDILILDECQHSATESAVTIYQKCNPKLELGLTATPYRVDRMKLCFSRVIRDAGIRSLIDQGYLSPYNQYVFNEEWTPENVAKVYLSDPIGWGKSVIYFLTKEHCDTCAELIRAAGIGCEVVWAGSDQETQIDSFMAGEIPVLLNILILTEGFNCPELNTVFVRPGSKGPTIQMSGRVFRRAPGKSHAQIVQNNTTNWPFTRIASCEQKFVFTDGQWDNRSTIGDKVAHASKASIMAISRIPTTMPQFILNKRAKSRRRLGVDE